MSTISLFPTLIYKTKFTGNLEALKLSLMPRLNEQFEFSKNNNQGFMRNDGLCFYNITRDAHNWPEMQPVTDFIAEHATKYWDELNYTGLPVIEEMWANIYYPESHIAAHTHSPMILTACFYLEKNDNTGNIVFENPLSQILKFHPYKITPENYTLALETEVNTESGDLIIFPGYLSHRTLPNNSSDNRIIIGANIKRN